MRAYVGTSGWSYKEWKGSFYPSDLPADEMLRYYAERFASVEVNNSFYRVPSERVLMQWAEQAPADFRFVLKASRRITHNNRLTAADDSLEYFLRIANVLGDRRGPTLFQLPQPQEGSCAAAGVPRPAPEDLERRDGIPPRLLVRGRRV